MKHAVTRYWPAGRRIVQPSAARRTRAAATATPRCREPLISCPPCSRRAAASRRRRRRDRRRRRPGSRLSTKLSNQRPLPRVLVKTRTNGARLLTVWAERRPVAGQDVGDRRQLLQRRGERLAVVGHQARTAAADSSWVLVRIESISSPPLLHLGEQRVGVDDQLGELAVAVGEHLADLPGGRQQLPELGVARGDGVREAGQALQRGAHLVRGVGEGLRQHLEGARPAASVSMSSTVVDRSAKASTTS